MGILIKIKEGVIRMENLFNSEPPQRDVFEFKKLNTGKFIPKSNGTCSLLDLLDRQDIIEERISILEAIETEDEFEEMAIESMIMEQVEEMEVLLGIIEEVAGKIFLNISFE